MSRLQPLHIPFAQGETDEISPKLLPNGVFADVQNGRLPQQGGLRLRRGWRPLTMATDDGDTVSAVDVYALGTSLVARCTRASEVTHQRLAVYTAANASHPWHLPSPGPLPAATNVRDLDTMPESSKTCLRASSAITHDGVYGCVVMSFGSNGSGDYSRCSVVNVATGVAIAYFQLSTGIESWHVVSAGTTFRLLRRDASGAVTLYILDPTAANPATLTGPTTLIASGVPSGGLRVAVAREATPTLLHCLTLESGTAVYRQFTLDGVSNGSASLTSADALAIASDDSHVWVLLKDSSAHTVNLTTLSATSPFSTTVGPTTLFSSHVFPASQYPLGVSYNTTNVFVAAEDSTTGTALGGVTSTQHDVYTAVCAQYDHSTSYSTVHSNAEFMANWLVKGDYAAVGLFYVPVEGGSKHLNVGYNAYVGCSSADSSLPWFFKDFSVAETFGGVSPRFHLPVDIGQGTTSTALVTQCVITPVGAKRPIVRALDVASTARRQASALDDVLYVTGGELTQFTPAAANAVENGLVAPLLRSWSISAAGGSVADGTYSYVAICVWTDSQHRVHRSPVSQPTTVTMSGGPGETLFTFSIPKSLRRDSASATPPRIELYRTEDGPGDLFYYTVAANITSTADDLVSLTDLTADADLIDNPQLYTQGETGATSGILEQAPPAPSAYAAATKRRLILGNVDASYQWSQATLPDIPVFFAEPGISGDAAQAYFDDVEGNIMGVAAMDELVYIGTSKRIFITGGVGPNLAGTGEFTPPQALPADVGFYNAQTLLVTSEGLWFQGGATTMYLLARGTPTPTLSRAVQDHMTGTIVGCGYGATDNIAAWAMASPNRVLFRQLDIKQWFNDTLPFTPVAMCDVEGQLYAVASDGVVWTQDASAFGDAASGATGYALQVTTGALVPFGIAGWGRVAVIEVLGEYQADATVLTEISYDDGATWTTLGGGAFTVSGLSAGATWSRQFYPLRQRGGRFRVRLTMTPSVSTTEGSRLTGLTVYYVLKSGQTRLDSAKRK